MSRMEYEMEELLPIVAKLAEQYSGYESTSVTYEKAEQLMGAVLYCINEYRMSDKETLMVRDVPAADAYENGRQAVILKVKEMNKIYNILTGCFCSYGNTCLSDTILKGIPEFLKWYDARYEPQNTILTLDYPILKDLGSRTGIDAVYEYVESIYLEQKFLKSFDQEYIERILYSYSPEYKDMIENIFEIVFLNIIIHLLLKKSLKNMEFTDQEYAILREMFKEHSIDKIAEKVELISERFIREYYKDDKQLFKYINRNTRNISARIKNIIEFGGWPIEKI